MVPSRRQEKRSPAPYPRAWRINQVVRQVLAEEIERLADADERLRLVTITGVETAPDLRHATVFVSSLSDEAAACLAERRGRLQATVGRQVRMKRTPLLVFVLDPAVVAGDRVDDALRRLRSDPDAGSSGPASS
jgi:ribosome-binding factor A